MKTIGIFGSQGFAREVADIAIELGYSPIFILRNKADSDNFGSLDYILEDDIFRVKCDAYAMGVGDNTVRMTLAKQYSDKLFFPNLIHPSATFGAFSNIAIDSCSGGIICAGVRMTNNIKLGNFNILNLNVTVGHDCIFHDYINVAPGVNVSGNVEILDASYIGTGATILQGTPEAKLVIGKNTIIGAGAVVTSDCDSNAIYTGIPARRKV